LTGADRVGVIGTEGTIRSAAYQTALTGLGPAVEVRAAACPLFVPLAEEGWGDHPVTDQVARHYLTPLLEWRAGALILGCTHYPLLRPSLRRVVGPEVHLVDSASAVTEAVVSDHAELIDTSHGNRGDIHIQLTDASDRFLRITNAILGRDPEHLEVVDIDSAA
jgi:glutamate racemase